MTIILPQEITTMQATGYHCTECEEVIDNTIPNHIKICDKCFEELEVEMKHAYIETIK